MNNDFNMFFFWEGFCGNCGRRRGKMEEPEESMDQRISHRMSDLCWVLGSLSVGHLLVLLVLVLLLLTSGTLISLMKALG